MTAGLDAAMVGIDGFDPVGVRGVTEVELRLGEQVDLVGLQRQQTVGAAIKDGLGDLRGGAHGVDGDQGAFQGQPLEQKRDGLDLVGLLGGSLLTQHQALVAGPGRDEVKRAAASGAIVAAARRLAVA